MLVVLHRSRCKTLSVTVLILYSSMLRLSILWYKHKTQDMTRKAQSYLNTTHIIFLCSLLKKLVETTIFFKLHISYFRPTRAHNQPARKNLPSVRIRCVFNNFTSICSICPSSSLSSFTQSAISIQPKLFVKGNAVLSLLDNGGKWRRKITGNCKIPLQKQF